MINPRKFSILGSLIVALVLVLAVGSAVPKTASAEAEDLFISEYIEGSSLNKAVEIYNGTGAAVDLAASGYVLEIYFNGNTSVGTTVALTGVVADGDVYVVADDGADPAILAQTDQQSTSSFFNGDDAVVLGKNGAVVDAFGQVGFDPGSEWAGGGQDDTLRRAESVCAGDTNPDDAFDASVEWISFSQNTFDGLGSHTADCNGTEPGTETILLTELVVTPTGGEFIEIHNPTSETVDLSDYYVTDATFAGGGTYYYNIVTGSNAGGGGFGDFHARFPDGATIPAGAYQTIAMAGSSSFVAEYGIAPDYELFDDSSDDGEQEMREALAGSINDQGGLTNGGEVVVLYTWDGQSDLVSDVDYALWGDKDEAVDKTGVALDGPDTDSDASTYLPDTAISSQDVISAGAHASGDSWQREDLGEGTEVESGGNGLFGNDETSEDLSTTWCSAVPTPGAATDCNPPPPPATGELTINELHADPDSNAGDANGDGTSQVSDDEFVELVNHSNSDLDISGWTVSDGFGVRHVFPEGTVVTAKCAVVVFGGGSPTGEFGGATVQTASNGALGLNNGGDTVSVHDEAGNLVAIYAYGGEGGDNQSLTRDPDVTGSEPLVRHSTATGSGGALFSPGTRIDGSQFIGCACGDPATFIYDVQGSGLASPLEGQTVVVEGVVVGDFQDNAAEDSGDLDGFHLQEEDADADGDPATSDGVFIYAPPWAISDDVVVGDVVRVLGDVSEFFNMTQVTATEIAVCSSGASVTPATVTLPVDNIDDLEAYEGMSVTLPQALVISEFFNFDRFGEIVLTTDRQFQPTAVHEPGSLAAAALADLNRRSRITLDDGRTSQNPDPAIHPNGMEFDLGNLFRGGDTVQNVTGVLDFSFGLYRVQPTQGADYTAVNTRPDTPEDVGGDIQVASFNVLNYFTTIDMGQDDCGPSGDLECRGADTAEELQRQRAKILAAIAEMDAEVVGLIEIQNDEGQSTADLVNGLNDLLGPGTYDYIDTGFIGTDAIKQAFIYQPGEVTPEGDYAVLDSDEFVDPNNLGDPKNRPALAQTFRVNDTGGVFTAVVNHLKSKGSPCGPGDDDPVQGSCNVTRTLAAQMLVDWLATDPTGSGDADFLIIGDLNAYDKEDPIDALVDAGYADLVAQYGGEFAYSYVFDGQLGYLDHSLANANLLPQVTGTTVWHINADEADLIDYDTSFKQDAQDAIYAPNEYRSSDHDPVIVGLDVGAPFCGDAMPSSVSLWPPNHRFHSIDVLGVTDQEGDPITITIDAIYQDEAVDADESGNTAPDGMGVGTSTAEVRAERVGLGGNGRVYHIFFTATDSTGLSCSGEVLVSVPVGRHLMAVDDGALFDSTVIPE